MNRPGSASLISVLCARVLTCLMHHMLQKPKCFAALMSTMGCKCGYDSQVTLLDLSCARYEHARWHSHEMLRPSSQYTQDITPPACLPTHKPPTQPIAQGPAACCPSVAALAAVQLGRSTARMPAAAAASLLLSALDSTPGCRGERRLPAEAVLLLDGALGNAAAAHATAGNGWHRRQAGRGAGHRAAGGRKALWAMLPRLPAAELGMLPVGGGLHVQDTAVSV